MDDRALLIATPQDGAPYAGLSGLTCKISSADTSGAFTVLELRLAPGEGAPLHVHRHEDELVYVRDGVCTVAQPGREWSAPAGSLVVFPRNTAHAFRNTGGEPCTLLITAIPGGLDRYFAEVSAALLAQQPERVAAINERYGITFLPA